MKKKILSLLLALTLLCGLMPAALAAESMDNFGTAQTYPAGKFTDVSDSAWYAESVKTAYELGLVQGSSETTFNPDGNITIGSTIALAARLHSIYTTGSADFTQGDPWYQVYVDYAVDNGIITAGQFSDYNANATRRQFAGILSKALPEEELGAINEVEEGDIPDLTAGSTNYEEIYMLYRAGVLTGSDKYGTFAPETTIGRSSVAAIVARMAVPALRQKVTLVQAATGITLDQTSLALNPGGTATLTATVTPDDAEDKTVTWTSSNTRVATVSNGAVTAAGLGTATITASTVNGKTATCTVTVAERQLSTTPLYEDSNVKITFVKAEPYRYDDSELEVYLDVDNKTSQMITVQCDAINLNGYSFNDVVISDDVSANSIGTVTVTVRDFDKYPLSVGNIESVGGQFNILIGGTSGDEQRTILFDDRNIYTGQTEDNFPTVSGEALYSDTNLEFYFGYAQNYPYDDTGSEIEVYLWVRNKSDRTLTIQNETLIVDRRSYNDTVISDPVLPNATGYVCITVRNYSGSDPASLTTVGGDFNIIDDAEFDRLYTLSLGSSGSGVGDVEDMLNGGGRDDNDDTWDDNDNGDTGDNTGDGSDVVVDLDATYDDYPSVPDFGAVMGTPTLSVDPDDDATMYTYALSDIPGGASNRNEIMDLYIQLLEGHGYRYSNSQGGVSYGYTYDVYMLGSFPNIQMMVSVGYIYNGSTPIAIAIRVAPF